jgi:hypothetical protein
MARGGSWLLASFAFTFGWWWVVSQVLHASRPVVFFLVPTLASLLLSWAFGMWSKTSSLLKTIAVSALTLGMLVTAILIVAIIAVSPPNTANSQEGNLNSDSILHTMAKAEQVGRSNP